MPFGQRLQDQGQYLRVAFVHKQRGQASFAVPGSSRPRLLLLVISHEKARQEKGRRSMELSDAFLALRLRNTARRQKTRHLRLDEACDEAARFEGACVS